MQTWKCDKCGEQYAMYDMDCPLSEAEAKCNRKGCSGILKHKECGAKGYSNKIEDN
jgi:hypothetical protein